MYSTPLSTPGRGLERCVETNAHSSGDLLYHCRTAGFVYCSTGSVYGYPGQRPLTEADGPGVPLRANYSFSKVAGEAVCTWVASIRHPADDHPDLLDVRPRGWHARRAARPDPGRHADRLHPDKPNNYNPIYEDDYVELGIRAMEVGASPPVVNWAGSETVSVEDYCAYMGELVGAEPIFEYMPAATRRSGPMSPTCTTCSATPGFRGGRASGG